MRNKRAKQIYDKLRYRKKKLINVIEKMQKYKNIYNNPDRNKISNYTKKQIEELYKKAIYEKDKYARNKLNELGRQYTGTIKSITKDFVNDLQKDLKVNIYGKKFSKMANIVKIDTQNFDLLFSKLTTEQKAEFLNSTSYYGARRYQKPPAESESFNLQVKQDGASYIVQDLIKYYKDNGLTISRQVLNNIKKIQN